ncbi:MAG: glycosyltransferase family 4 protein [Chloroflexi bacterium]|nr:glycosyltransferase family 4 protein [Chloroflexota bacterium]
MRIVFVGTFGLQPKGTVSARALPLSQALTREGHAVSVIVPPWDHPADSGREFSIDGVGVVNIRLPRRLPLYYHLAITLRLLRRVLAERPDVVHFFKPKGYAGFAAMLLGLLKALRLSHVRIVVDSDDWEGKGGWNELGGYTWWQRKLFSFQERWGLRHAERVTVSSRALQARVEELGVSRDRIFYLPNGVPTERPSTREGREAIRKQVENTPVILLYTRFFEFSPQRLVEILRLVFGPAPEARLLVVGEGLAGEEEALKQEAIAAGFLGRISFAGWVDSARLGDYFGAADLAIYPMDDTLLNRCKCPVKLVELLGAGLPVVADRVGEAAEYIEPEVSGILVGPGQTQEFAAAVVRLLEDGGLRERLGERARERARAVYSWDKLADIALGAYRG